MVTYSGGCKEHSFDMVGSQNISKSLPPIRQIRLIHNGNEDHCRELITRTLKVDLSDMAYSKTSGSEIVLNLKGAREPINYIFQ